jgi:hypothetical protein
MRDKLFRKMAEILLVHASGLSQWQTAEEFYSRHPTRPQPDSILLVKLHQISGGQECFGQTNSRSNRLSPASHTPCILYSITAQ